MNLSPIEPLAGSGFSWLHSRHSTKPPRPTQPGHPSVGRPKWVLAMATQELPGLLALSVKGAGC